jgi:hypothetical protein
MSCERIATKSKVCAICWHEGEGPAVEVTEHMQAHLHHVAYHEHAPRREHQQARHTPSLFHGVEVAPTRHVVLRVAREA